MKTHNNFQNPYSRTEPSNLYLLENEIDRMFVNSQVQQGADFDMSFAPLTGFTKNDDDWNISSVPLDEGFDELYCLGKDVDFKGALGIVNADSFDRALEYFPSLAAEGATQAVVEDLKSLFKDNRSVADIKIASFNPVEDNTIPGLIFATRSLPYKTLTVMLNNIRHNVPEFVKDFLTCEGYERLDSGLYVRNNPNADFFKDSF